MSEKREQIRAVQQDILHWQDELKARIQQVKHAEAMISRHMKRLDKIVLKPPVRDRKGRLVYK